MSDMLIKAITADLNKKLERNELNKTKYNYDFKKLESNELNKTKYNYDFKNLEYEYKFNNLEDLKIGNNKIVNIENEIVLNEIRKIIEKEKYKNIKIKT